MKTSFIASLYSILVFLKICVKCSIGGTDGDLLDSTNYYENIISPPNAALTYKLTHSYGLNLVYDGSSEKIFSSLFCSINITNEYANSLNTENSHSKGYYRLVMYENNNPSSAITFDQDYRSVNGELKYHSCHINDLGNRLLLFTSGPNLEVNNAVLNNPTFTYATLYKINFNNPNRFVLDTSHSIDYSSPIHIYPNQNTLTYMHSSRYISSVYDKDLKSVFVLMILSK